MFFFEFIKLELISLFISHVKDLVFVSFTTLTQILFLLFIIFFNDFKSGMPKGIQGKGTGEHGPQPHPT